MAGGGTIGGDWQGLRNDVAAYLLSANESPSCMDVAVSLDQRGVLGARRGRARRYTTGSDAVGNIVGVFPFNFPWVQGRIIADSGGVWTIIVGVPAPAPLPAALDWTGALMSSAACSGGAITPTVKTLTVVGGLLVSAV